MAGTGRGIVALAVAAALALGCLIAWKTSAEGRGVRAASPAVALAVAPTSTPSSLAGTTPYGSAHADATDSLLLTPELIRLFEYYLSSVGERPLASIRSQIEQDLDGRLGPNAARQAKEVLRRYLAYRDAVKAAASADGASPTARAASGPTVDRLRAAWVAMQTTRARFFSAAEAAALFGPDDAMAQAALDRLAAAQDPVATPEERRRRLAALDAASPAAAQAREASNLVNRLNDETRRILAAGGSEDEVYRMRAAAVSPEAANRLADLDRDEARWNARIADYLQQRGTLRSGPQADADAALDQLRARMFTPEEQRRLAAYER